MKVTIFGTGYVGLVTGVCLAEIGHKVIGIDVDQKKINQINKGKSPIYEKNLENLLVKNLANHQVIFTTDAEYGIKTSDFLFIAVGTPSSNDGSADLKYVFEVVEQIGKFLDHDAIVIIKSTVPVGTGIKARNKILEMLRNRGVSYKVSLVSNPEFLKQGEAIGDFMRSDRIIIGAEEEEVLNKVDQLYLSLNTKIVHMDLCSAELSKYAANAFLATKISFINELAQISEKLGADIEKIREGIGSDPRIGSHFLRAGCGYGGSCFPKDVDALIWMCRENGIESSLLKSIVDINLRQKYLIFRELNRVFQNLEGKVFALWGLAFKPNTDDMREAPSRVLMEALWRSGAKLQVYDPVANDIVRNLYPNQDNLFICPSKEETLERADALIIVTEWNEFKELNFNLLHKKLKHPFIFDGRNLFDPKLLQEQGFHYYCIGRKKYDD